MTTQKGTLEVVNQNAIAIVQQQAPLAAAMLETVRGMQITDAESCGEVADVRKRLNQQAAKLKATKGGVLDPLKVAVKNINAIFKPSEDAIEEALSLTKAKLDGWAHQQLVIESERRATALREAREQEEAAREAAAKLRASGADSTAAIVEAQAASAIAMSTGPAQIEKVRGSEATFSARKHWVGRVVSVRAFCAAVGRGEIPETCININVRALNDHAKTLGEPMVASDPAAITKLYMEQGFSIALVAEGATR